MATDLKVIEQQALELSAADRVHLADRLLASLNTETADLESAWEAECEHRLASFERGEVEALDGDSVMRELRAKLRR
ncbi:MAG: addiction module protein [Verrucomicrobiota bacterium JB022]|nr:addiction module protein [Verrucomicrobiota bacterium JB022]